MLCLLLRLHAKFPTIYQNEVDWVFCFDEQGVERKHIRQIPSFLNDNLNGDRSRIWALVDSNRTFKDVPDNYPANQIFVVQTPSPRTEHLEWGRKIDAKPVTFILEPWSLPEIICAWVIVHCVAVDHSHSVYAGALFSQTSTRSLT